MSIRDGHCREERAHFLFLWERHHGDCGEGEGEEQKGDNAWRTMHYFHFDSRQDAWVEIGEQIFWRSVLVFKLLPGFKILADYVTFLILHDE